MRYESYGVQMPTPYGLKYRAYYDFWTQLNARIATLEMHTTQIMLRSLGLPSVLFTPIFTLREDPPQVLPANYVVIAVGDPASL